MAFPTDPLDLTVELAIGADIHADPSTWSWTDVTSRTEGVASTVSITRGRRSRVGPYAPMQVSAVVDNTDGNLSRHNPNSSYFGQLKKNTPMRVRVDNGSGPVTRAAAYVPGFPPRWDRTGRNHTVTLKAVGITDRLGRGRGLRSALHRSLAGVAPGDYVPHAYWSMEDGSEATSFASGLANGSAAVFGGGVNPASSNDGLAGSEALPTMETGASVAFPIASYTNTDQWVLQFCLNVPAALSAETTLFTILSPGGTIVRWEVSLNPNLAFPPALDYRVRGYNSAGVALIDNSKTAETDTQSFGFYGNWVMAGLMVYQSGGNVACRLNMASPTRSASGVVVTTAGTHSAVTSLQMPVLGSSLNGLGLGHVALFTDPNFTITVDDVANAAAMDGYAGELAHARAERLCHEARIPFTTAATISQAMGAQTTKRLLDLLKECADADVGLLVENMDFGLTFISSTERYNLSPTITLDYDADEIMAPWEPADDDQDYNNEIVASRTDGASIRLAAEDEVDDVGEYSRQVTPNVETDTQLTEVGGWYLNLGLEDDLTWPAVSPNIQNDSALLDDWLATDLGHALHVVNHPEPLAPDTIRQIVEGYTEVWGLHTATATAVLSPQAPWDVAELDDDDSGKLDTAGCVMQAGASSAATSFTVHTEVLPKWTTDAGEMPIPIITSGQVNSVTAVSNVSPAFLAAGTAAHGNNASVVPGMPAGVQEGDLLLVFAAIRNSGTGTVNTPSGYTELLTSGNMALFGKVHTGTESAPTVTFTGGAANADTSAQMAGFRGVGITVHASSAQLNASAQNIAYPALDVSRDNCVIVYLGWKQDDWTSVATIAGASEMGEPDTTTGDDQGLVWDVAFQTTATAISSGSFTVTGGASAISRGAVIAFATDVQTMTVTRGTNGVTKAIPIGSQVNVYKPARLAL